MRLRTVHHYLSLQMFFSHLLRRVTGAKWLLIRNASAPTCDGLWYYFDGREAIKDGLAVDVLQLDWLLAR